MGFNSAFEGLKSDKNTGYCTWRTTYIFNNISLSSSYNEIFFRQSCRRIKTRVSCTTIFFFGNRVVYEITRKNMVQRDKQSTNENIVWRKRFACWITTATDTNSEYVISIASPRQMWFDCLTLRQVSQWRDTVQSGKESKLRRNMLLHIFTVNLST